MLKSLALVVSLFVVAAAAAQAQAVRTPKAPVAPLDMGNIEAAMIAAQAAAVKTGDEALPCEALQKELVSTMTDPAIQAYAAKSNAAVAKELAANKTKTAMTPQTAAALAASLNPAMMMAGLTGASPLVPGQQMTPEQMQQMMLAQMQQLAVIMPVMMRTQRVTQLAMVKNCPWATGAGLGLYPGTVRPGVVLPPGTTLPPGTALPR